jgi:NTE family protein
MRVGLVLGGGGVVGLAYHAAALAAIEHDLGWDPRTADVIVGTSAGALVGALLRVGVPASDLSFTAVGAAPRSSPPGVAQALRDRPDLPPLRLASFLGLPRVPSPAIVAAWARRPWRFDPLAALASVIPDGSLDLAEHAAGIEAVLGDRWPDDDLWLCTVRQRDLRRVVFGRDASAPLAQAVHASCAVPGYFRPVRIGEQTYIDGGVRSPTNADVLRRRALDLVIVVSPMSGRELGRVGLGNLIRRRARTSTQAERGHLWRAGIPSVLVEPGPEVVDVCGLDFMDDAHLPDIVRAAFLDTGDVLRTPRIRARLAEIDGRVPGRSRHRPAPCRRWTGRRPRDRAG